MYERGRDEDAGAEAQQDGADDVLAPGVLAPVGPAHEAPEKNVNSYEIFENLGECESWPRDHQHLAEGPIKCVLREMRARSYIAHGE